MPAATSDSVFVMLGARSAVADGMLHIEEQVKALEQAVTENTGLAFDLAKTLIESVCKTILSDRDISFEKDDDLPKLFKAATMTVPFLPVAIATEAGARKSLKKTLGGLKTAVQGICELRNAFGFASHGSDSPRPAMEGAQVLFAAQAADTIVGFLYRVHQEDLSRPRTVPLKYDDSSDFNEWLDEQCEMIRILALPPYRPSDVLFNVDQEAYRDILANYNVEDKAEMDEEDNEVSE